MSIPFIDRPPSEAEVERFRLFLSNYPNALGNYYSSDELIYFWVLKDVLASAFRIPEDKISPSRYSFKEEHAEDIDYKICATSLWTDELETFCKKELTYSFSSSEYWNYLSKFDITLQNYMQNLSQFGKASLDLLRIKKGFENKKVVFLFLFAEDFSDQNDSHFKKKKEWHFYLSQYNPPTIGDLLESPTVSWSLSEDTTQRYDGRGWPYTQACIFLRAYENNNLTYEIEVPKVEDQILEDSTYSTPKKQKMTKRRKPTFRPEIYLQPDVSIKICTFLPCSRQIWQSKALKVEMPSNIEFMEYGAIATIKKQRELAIHQLEHLINNEAREEEFQQLLTKNWWMFGNEYGELISQRALALGTQQDFIVRRTADGFLEIIEIKRPLNEKALIYKTGQRENSRFHYRQELTDAIAQVIDYIDKVESNKHLIYYEKREDVGKIRAKIIIGRDGDEQQKRSLRNLNSSLHGVEILTYDQLLRIAKKSLEYQ